MVRGPTAKKRSGRRKVTRRNALRVRAPPTSFQVPAVRDAWDGDRTMRQNYKRLGLSTDLNAVDKVARDTGAPVELQRFELPDSDRIARESKRKVMTEAEQKYMRALVVRHGDDYDAMQRDLALNKQQHTAAHLRRRCTRFLLLDRNQLEVEPLPDHV